MGVVVICEDDIIQNEHIIDLLSTYSPLDNWKLIPLFTPAEFKAADKLLADADILLMDIHFENEDGIALVQTLQKVNKKTQIIYITGDILTCSDVYCTKHRGFVPKPIVPRKLYDAIDRILSDAEKSQQSFSIRAGAEICRYPISEIMYFEKSLRKIVIHSKQSAIEFYGKFEDFESQVEQRFVRCHSSFLVNMDCIEKVKREDIILENGTIIPISRRYAKEAKEKFWNYLHSTFDTEILRP